MKVNVDNLKK